MAFDPSYKQLFDEQGYVIIPDLVPNESRKELEAAAERAIARTRSGEWKHRRTVSLNYSICVCHGVSYYALRKVGSQFPPYNPESPDSWGVQHVMHPDIGEPAFARWYTSDPLIEAVKGLLGCSEDELQMGRPPA